VLFSHPGIVSAMNERFECAWEMVRPAPRVSIDFGDGRTLERTLSGNVATYVTLADGRVIDVVPGLVNPVEFQRRLDEGERLAARANQLPADLADDFVPSYHGDVASWDAPDPEARLAQLEQEQSRTFLAKSVVEFPIKDMLRGLHVERLRDERTFDSQAVNQAGQPGEEDTLLADTEYNVRVRYPKVRAILALAAPLKTPAELTSLVFEEVLDVDLDDPYLGLAPYVLGGEIGRH
jgi:hypothetical protein